ncbi:MAG: hypothetical protein JWO53_182 [Chlamydiia bacterium]|nr:hypothetical protein [Chlamydiia bacterium]
MLRYIFLLLVLAAIGYGGWYGWEHLDDLASQIPGLQKEETLLTFEVATTPDEIMHKHQKELLKSPAHTLSKTTIKYIPFFLLDVKYPRDDRKTEEGKVLWSLENGEMVLDTATFETTHGFEDCINAGAKDEDFRLMQVLNKKGGSMSKEALCQELGMESEALFERLEALRKKHLVTIRGDTVRIHLSTPLLKVYPETRITYPFVTKVVATENQFPQRYSKGQVRQIAKAAFGPDFAIRSEHLLFIPVFQIDVQNPDGSIHSTYWNGCTGKRVTMKQFI